ncbi:hypothetical protein GCM10022221_65450 [Actinocorallia aurea]
MPVEGCAAPADEGATGAGRTGSEGAVQDAAASRRITAAGPTLDTRRGPIDSLMRQAFGESPDRASSKADANDRFLRRRGCPVPLSSRR